jgi:probable rRNA maturation factor
MRARTATPMPKKPGDKTPGRSRPRRPKKTAAPRPAGGSSVALSLDCEAWEAAVPDVETLCRTAAETALNGARVELPALYEVSLVLTTDAEIRILNRMWRNQDKPTNVLSFPGDMDIVHDDAPVLLGDIVIAFETTRREVEEQKLAASLSDHLSHLIVHGVLHLLGYDHEIDEEAEEMEQLETELLAGLGIPNPYADHERRLS